MKPILLISNITLIILAQIGPHLSAPSGSNLNHRFRFAGVKHELVDLAEAKKMLRDALSEIFQDGEIVVQSLSDNEAVWYFESLNSMDSCPVDLIREKLSKILDMSEPSPDKYRSPLTRNFKMAWPDQLTAPSQVHLEYLGPCDNENRKRSRVMQETSPTTPPESISTTLAPQEPSTMPDTTTTQKYETSPDSFSNMNADPTTTTKSSEPDLDAIEATESSSPPTTTTNTTASATTTINITAAPAAATTTTTITPDSEVSGIDFSIPTFKSLLDDEFPPMNATVDFTNTTKSTDGDSPATSTTPPTTPAPTLTTETPVATIETSTAVVSGGADSVVGLAADDDGPHYGKYLGLGAAFLIFLAYLFCSRAFLICRRHRMYELHAE